MLSNTKNGGKPRCSRRVIKGSVTQHDSSSNIFLRRRLRQKYFCINRKCVCPFKFQIIIFRANQVMEQNKMENKLNSLLSF